MSFIVDIVATFKPIPPDETWDRFGRLPAPAYLWCKRGDENPITDLMVTDAPDAKIDGFEVLDSDLNKGKDGMSIYLAISRSGVSGILDIKVAQKDEAVGTGYIRLEQSLSSVKENHLCYQTEKSLADEQSLSFEINVGDMMDIKDKVNKWCIAKILQIDDAERKLYVHYEGWSDKWNEWVDMEPDRMAKYRTHTAGYTGASQGGSAPKLGADNIEDFNTMSAKLNIIIDDAKDLNNLDEEDSKFLNDELPGHIVNLLNATIDDADIVVRVHGFFNSSLTLVARALQTKDDINLDWIKCVLFLFGGDANSKRFYYRYGVSAEEIDEPGNYAVKVLKKVEYGQNQDSIYQVRSINHFGDAGGFDACIQRIHKGDLSLTALCYLSKVVAAGADFYVEEFSTRYMMKFVDSVILRADRIDNDDVKATERDSFVDLIKDVYTLTKLVPEDQLSQEKAYQVKEELTLHVFYKLLSSPFLGKKVFGLNQVCELIEALKQQERFKKAKVRFGFINSEYLINWIQEKDLLGILLGQDIHQEILKRTPEILKFLAFHDALSDKNMHTLWESSIAQHESIVRSVYTTIGNLSQELSVHLLDVMFELIDTLKFEQYNDYTLEFIKTFTFNAIIATDPEEGEGKDDAAEENRNWYGLDLFWKLIQEDNPVDEDLAQYAFDALMESLRTDMCVSQRPIYLGRAIENMKGGKSVPQSLDLVTSILSTYRVEGEQDAEAADVVTESDLCVQLQQEHQLLELVCDEVMRYRDVAKSVRDENKNDVDTNKLVVSGKRSHQSSLASRLNFLRYIITRSPVELTESVIGKLWNVFVFDCAFDADSISFFQWLTRLREIRSDHSVMSNDMSDIIFNNYLTNPEQLNPGKAPIEGYYCFQSFFKFVNTRAGNLFKLPRFRRYRTDNTDLIGLNSLWGFISSSVVPGVFDKASSFLQSLYFNLAAGLPMLQNWHIFVNNALDLVNETIGANENPDESTRLKATNIINALVSFLGELEKRANVPGSTVVRDSRGKYYLSRVEVTVLISHEQNEIDYKKTVSVKVEFSKRLAYVRRELSRLLEIDPARIRLYHGLTGTVLWEDEADQRSFKEVGIQDEDELVAVIMDNPQSSSPPESISEDVAQIRNLLSNDAEKFQQLFNLLKLGGEIGDLVWGLLQSLPKNQGMSDRLHHIDVEDLKWDDVIDTSAILKLLYSLQIVQADILSNENTEELDSWCKSFVERGGLAHIYTALQNIPLQDFFGDSLLSESLARLLRLINDFASGDYAKFGDPNTRLNFIDFNELNQTMMELVWRSALVSQESDAVDFEALMAQAEFDFDEKDYAGMLAGDDDDDGESMIGPEGPPSGDAAADDSEEKDDDSMYVVEECFKLLASSLTITHAVNVVVNYENLGEMIENGLLHNVSSKYRGQFMKGMVALCESSKELTEGLVSLLVGMIPSIDDECSTASDFFELTQMLLKLHEGSSLSTDTRQIFGDILQKIQNHPIIEQRPSSRDPVLEGLFGVGTELLSMFPQYAADCEEAGMLDHMLHECLFHYPNPNQGLIPPPKCKSVETRGAAFSFMHRMIQGNPEDLLSVARFVTEKNHMTTHSGGNKLDDFKFHPSIGEKSSTGYVGLKNLGCICYMNSLIQQLFMIPTLRTRLLEIEEKPDPEVTEDEFYRENFLYQLQYILGFLQESEKSYANPKQFCHSFKDWDGSPTNVSIQKDTNEFLNMLFDRIDTRLIGTKYEKVLKNELGGCFANQLVGTRNCPHKKERAEPFYCVTINVKNKKSVIEGLEAFVEGEMLAGDNAYMCSKCDKKVDTLKRVVLKDLPKTVVLHLKRFELDFNTFQMVKLNDRCEFPQKLNLRSYTREGIAEREKDENKKDDGDGKDEDIDPIEERPDWYYDYTLTGILIHIGSANAGHYYSFIKEKPDPNDPTIGEQWFEFNDTIVRPFDPKDIPDEAFGGEEMSYGKTQYVREKAQNAYLLFYTRNEPVEEKDELPEEVAALERRSSATKVKIPPKIFDQIWEENETYWRDKYVYDVSYFDFLKSMTQRSNVDLGDEKNNETRSALVQLGTRFLFDTLARSLHQDDVADWVEWLKDCYKTDVESSFWLVDTFAKSKWARDLLLRCPHVAVRKSVATILNLAIGHVLGDEEELAKLREVAIYEAKEQSGEGENEDVAEVEVPENPSMLGRLMDSFLELMPQTPYYWNQFSHFFRVLLEISQNVDSGATYLITRGLISKMIHGFIGGDSPYPDIFPTPVNRNGNPFKFGGNFATPDTTKFLELLDQLIASPAFAEFAPAMDMEMASGEDFLNNMGGAGHTRLRGKAIGNIVAHFSRENSEYTDNVLVCVSEGIENEDREGIRPYFRLMTVVLAIDDSLASTRIDSFMSSLMSVFQINKKYWRATMCCIEHTLRLANDVPAVNEWLQRNPRRFQWMVEWLTANGDHENVHKTDLRVSKPSKRENQYNYRGPSASPYGFSLKQKLAMFEKLGTGSSFDDVGLIHDSGDDLACREFAIGEEWDVHDKTKKWCTGVVVGVTEMQVRIHYKGWSDKWDEWMDKSTPKIQPFGSRVRPEQEDPAKQE